MSSDRAVSGFDLRHRFVQTVFYDIAFASGLHGFATTALDAWQVSTIMTFQSEFPASITYGGYGGDTTGTGIGSRLDMVAGWIRSRRAESSSSHVLDSDISGRRRERKRAS